MRYACYLLLFLFALPLCAQDADEGGIAFVEKPFADLLAQAKAEDKIIFIDAYTTWCGPCKMMSAKVFPQKEVGAVYNERFVNAKIDMEKGEGPELAKRYGVAAYPTYLFVDGNGDIVHKGVGYVPAQEFIALADDASGPESLGMLTKQYRGGDRDPEFVLNYYNTLQELHDKQGANTVLQEYLAGQEDWSDPAIMGMLVQNPGAAGSKSMNYLLENFATAAAHPDADNLVRSVQIAMVTKYMEEAGVRALPPAEKMTAIYETYAAPLRDRLAKHYAMFYPQQQRDMDGYLAAAAAYFSAYPSNSYVELNSLAWTIFENSDDAETLRMGLKMAQQSVALNENYANLDTLAWLYQKTGDQAKAAAAAKKAIALAKDMGVDYSNTAKILEK